MMMIIASLAALSMVPGAGQDTAKAEVVAAARAWLDAFEQRDAERYAELTHPDGVSFTLRMLPGREGVRVLTNRRDIDTVADPGPRYREVFWNPEVRIRGDLAHLWAPYSFDIDGERSHCGIDSFTFFRIDGTWKYVSGSWTVEPPATCVTLGEPK